MIINSFKNFSQHKDIYAVLFFSSIILMIIIPLPTIIIDLLITVNISAAILVLIMTLHLKQPIQFTTFPAVLLATTIFRLAISISTTRLILVEGDAGDIVETFGSLVTANNIIVGLVIFLIITVVQFLVITKGADRVAEVGARFTLDAMPGKQMSIDADVRAGTIDETIAQERRQILERESKLFGAMDGAMKFVKGDAVAGLVITFINLIGGIAIGVGQIGLPFSEAAVVYSMMTIGDGLVAQLPALLISVSAGTMVTRVTSPKNIDLGTEISEQFTENSRTIIGSGILIAIFGLVPGFPLIIFMTAGLGMSLLAYLKIRKQEALLQVSYNSWDSMYATEQKNWDEIRRRTGRPETLKIVLPNGFRSADNIEFSDVFDFVRQNLTNTTHLNLGYWTYEFRQDDLQKYEIYLNQNLIDSGDMFSDCVFVKCSASYLMALDIPVHGHFGTKEGVLVHEEHMSKLVKENIVFLNAIGQVNAHIMNSFQENMDLLADHYGIVQILDEERKQNQSLVTALEENVSVNQISVVIRRLFEERIPLTLRSKILEAIYTSSIQDPDPLSMLQQVRISIGSFITNRYAPNNFLSVLVLTPSLESKLREGTRKGEGDVFLVMKPELSMQIADQVKNVVEESYNKNTHPVIITQQDVRRNLFNLLQKQNIFIPVLAYQEIIPSTIIYPIGFISDEI